MSLPSIFTTFLAVLSFSSISVATGKPSPSVIRVPLERKSFVASAISPNHGSCGLGATAAGNINSDFLKIQLADIASKYRNTFAAYELNTGLPHPLAHALSAIDGSGTNLAGKLKNRRRRDAASDSLAPSNLGRIARDRLTKRDDISLTEVNSNLWMGAISVGTPAQNFTVLFDTGSSDMVLPDQDCDSTCNGHTRFNHTASSTFVDLGKTFQFAYVDGSNVNGIRYADNVYMGGYQAVNQTFGAATTYSTGLQNPTFRPDGLLGMGFPQISVLGASPVFQTMVSNGAVSQGVFGFALSSESGKSELTIGGTNLNMYQESTTEYIDVAPPAFWQIPLAGVSRPSLDNASDVVVVNTTSYAQAIVDTGTTLIVTSDSFAQAYYANVTGAKPSTEIGRGVWSVPCDIIGSLVPTLTFGSRNFTVSPSTFNLGPVSQGSSDCIAGIAGGGSAWWIIGDVFLQNVYTIFDVANTRIGFADLA